MTTGILTRWWTAIALALVLLIGSPVAAAPIATCFVAARPGMTPALLFARPDLFDCRSTQMGRSPGDYWVIAPALPGNLTPANVVRTVSVWQRQTTLFVRYADGAVRATGFTSATTASHLATGAVVDLPLPVRAAPPLQLLWHIEGSGGARGIVTGARLIDAAERHREDLTMSVVYAALGGMMASLLVYNLALWRALRQSFQPAYCAMLALALAYSVSSSGLIEQLTGIDNNRRLILNALLLAATSASIITFARLFFGPEVFCPWLRRASAAVIAALVASAGAYALFAPWHIALLDQATNASFASLMVLVPAIFYRAWRMRNPHRWLFAIAWGAPILFGGIRLAMAVNLIDWRYWIDHSTAPAIAAEACLSALAIAARIRLISRERDEAREQEIAARLLADTDPLTGLLNRRSFLHRAIGRSGDQALILIDIDHFKRINETVGHDGGDDVLRLVAHALRADLPPDSLVARMGGEEFAILTPAADPPYPADILCRIRAARMPYDLTVTASTGACVGPLTTESDWIALYRHADKALFEAKAAGRDRSRAAPPLVCAA